MKRLKIISGLMIATAGMALFGAACGGDEEPTATATTRPATATSATTSPTAATSPTTTTTPGVGDAAKGQVVFNSKGCAACHSVTSASQSPSPVGPGLLGIGTRAGTRKAGVSAEAYLQESVLTPSAFVVPGFAAGIMPTLFTSADADFNDMIAYLLSLK